MIMIKIGRRFARFGKKMLIYFLNKIEFFVKSPTILTAKKTISYIRENKCSISRYGDGEFNFFLKNGSEGYQNYSLELSERLLKLLTKEKHENLLLCIPRSIKTCRGRNRDSKQFWENWCANNKIIYTYLSKRKNYVWGDSQITRPYIPMKSEKNADVIYKMLKQLWKDKNLLLVEGKQTKMGVGNDLFQEAKSIRRILVPAENAFEKYDTILRQIKSSAVGDELVLLAVGPTATILAADLSDVGIQCLDVGHLDIEYEWYLKKAKEKILIDGKYVNEVENGNLVNDDFLVSKTYLDEIVSVI